MKKYIIVLISVLFLKPQQTANGCGFTLMPEEYRVYLFNQAVLNKHDLIPLFYSSEFFYNPINWWEEAPLFESEENHSQTELTNAQEWKAHTHYQGDVKEMVTAIYKTELDSLLLGSELFFKQHPFLLQLKKNYQSEFDYLKYAKQCEFIYDEKDAWGLKENNNVFLNQLEKNGKEKLEKSKTEFLKIRYAYQLLKISFYTHIGDCEVSIFKKHIKNANIKSWLKASAQFYVNQSYPCAGEEEQDQPQTIGSAEWNYRLSLSFDKTIDKKMRCVQLFVRKNYLNYLALAKNNHEKAIMYVMYELQNPMRSLGNLKTIAALDPTNEYLPALIAREINKLEDWMLTPELTSEEPSICEYNESTQKMKEIKTLSSKKYAFDVFSFVSQLIKKNTSNQEAEYHLLASNLCVLLQDKINGEKHLELAEKTNKNNTKLLFQILYNKVAMQFDGQTALNDELKKHILKLVSFSKIHPQVIVNQETALSQLYLFIGVRLLKANDVANGILFCSKTTRPLGQIGYWQTKNFQILLLEKAKPEHYDALIALIDKPNKTEFDKFLLSRKDFSSNTRYTHLPDTMPLLKDKLFDYKSMYYVQHNQLDSALLCANKINSSYWSQYPYNLFKCFPFMTGHGKDYSSNNDFYRYDKRKYLQRMVSIKYLIDHNIGDIGKHCFVLANGYFNMSYHGNYWIMNMPYKLSDELQNSYYDFSNTNTIFLENYYGCKQAEYYYLKAFENTKDSSLAAICIHKANLCNQNGQEIKWRQTATYNENKYDWNKPFNPKYNTYNHLFIDKYNDQSFYDDFVSSCYYSYHLNKKFY